MVSKNINTLYIYFYYHNLNVTYCYLLLNLDNYHSFFSFLLMILIFKLLLNRLQSLMSFNYYICILPKKNILKKYILAFFTTCVIMQVSVAQKDTVDVGKIEIDSSVLISQNRSIIIADSLLIVEAQKDTIPNSSLDKTNGIIRAADAFVYTVISPVRWKGKDWLTAGSTLGGAALLTLADEPVNDFFHRDQGEFVNQLERVGFHNGKPYAAMIATGGFYLTGLVIKNEWAKETAIILGSAYLSSGAIQTLMKKVVGRARPGAGYGPYEFRPFHKEASFSSFPSGHVQIALVTSIVLAERVKPIWLKSIFYAGAAITFTSRMYVGAHWLSDLSFGSAISYFCTKTVMKRLEKTKYDNPLKNKQDKNKIKWELTPNFNGIGIVGIF